MIPSSSRQKITPIFNRLILRRFSLRFCHSYPLLNNLSLNQWLIVMLKWQTLQSQLLKTKQKIILRQQRFRQKKRRLRSLYKEMKVPVSLRSKKQFRVKRFTRVLMKRSRSKTLKKEQIYSKTEKNLRKRNYSK